MNRLTSLRAAVRAGLASCVVVLLTACGAAGGEGSSAPKPKAPSSHQKSTTTAGAKPVNPSGLKSIKESQLPKEAKDTLELIRKGGPYPFSRDGVHFGNFEKVLPEKKGSYYKEYTVKTPGVSSRGAKRIIVGGGREKYFTPDHYKTFRFIEEGS